MRPSPALRDDARSSRRPSWFRFPKSSRKRWWPADWSLHLEAAARQSQPGLGGDLVVVVPARNEAGNIEAAVQRTPELGLGTEIIFIEGHSKDNTWDEIQRM